MKIKMNRKEWKHLKEFLGKMSYVSIEAFCLERDVPKPRAVDSAVYKLFKKIEKVEPSC